MSDSIYTKPLPAMDFSRSTVLVVGDVMLDRYWQGSTDRISPEAPVPVVKVSDRSNRIGGAGNVAVNITTLGAKSRLLSVYGEDEAGADLAQLLTEFGVDDHCLQAADFVTTTKLRILSQHQQLIRLDFETTSDATHSKEILDRYQTMMADIDLVVLSDYGKGIVSSARSFIDIANANNKKVLVDPKSKDFRLYAGAHLITPNKKEFELAVGETHSQSDLEDKAFRLIKDCRLDGILVTQGDKGMTLVMQDQNPVQFPALAREVFDVTGAGDTVIASLAAGLSSGLRIEDAVHLSCVAASIVVGRVGTASVTQEDLKEAEHLSSEHLSSSKTLEADQVDDYLKHLRAQNKKIVFTNGCFDLLHSGHVKYLEQAAQLGDALIVAVNSDASVRGLKGDSRPINDLSERMSILAGLASVAKVISFDEPTPENLICRIRPDVLVKGGDYKVEEIAGRQCAGEVRLISFIEGRSTSRTVEKIKGKQ